MSSAAWDYSVFWKETLNQLRQEVSEQEWVMWFNNIAYYSSSESGIIVQVPSLFYRDQVVQRYLSLIEAKLESLSGRRLNLTFEIAQNTRTEAAPRPKEPVSSAPIKTKKRPHPGLKSDYVFDTFVVGENNSFAANAAYAIAKNPGTAYNPCLIYGGVGLGKTHLIQSIGNAAYLEFENIKVAYVTAETFTNEFIEAIRDKKNHLFK
ncbi:MAG TPA: DnaA/Hda family protein, partial [Spirochaetia bacterium]|nr:DnaA/Hda family protein [Spirochaetia bacterium]